MSTPERRLLVLASLTLALAACDSQADPAPGVQQDTSEQPEDTNVADSATPPDTAAPDTAPAEDTATTPDTADTAPPDTTPPDSSDTSEPDTTVTPDTTPADTGNGGEIVLPTVRPEVVTTSTTFIGDWEMEFGRETTKCVVKRLDNADTLWVSQIRTVLAKGSHHMIIYKSDDTEEQVLPFNCFPFIETIKGETFPLMITQIRDETLSFPNGVAFKFEPHQMVRIEAHYLNYFPDTTITAHGDVHFDGIAPEDVVSEANMLFYGNFDLDIPQGEFTTPWRYLSVFPGSHVFAVTGHTHAYGTNVEIAKSTAEADPGTSIYPGETPYDWEEPPVEQFEPPLYFDEQQGFRYRCSWNNTSGGRLGLGESAEDEMCFLWAYYYPSKGYRLCGSPGSIGNGIAGSEVCCPGHWVCDYIAQFF